MHEPDRIIRTPAREIKLFRSRDLADGEIIGHDGIDRSNHFMEMFSLQNATDLAYSFLSSGTPDPPCIVMMCIAFEQSATHTARRVTPATQQTYLFRAQRIAHHGDGLHGQLVTAELALDADDAPGCGGGGRLGAPERSSACARQ